MKKPMKKKVILFVTIIGLCLSACGNNGLSRLGEQGYHYYTPDSESQTEEATEVASLENLYLIVAIDTIEEKLQVYSYDNGMQYQYHYGLNTNFLDKYGNTESAANFTPGRVVWIGEVNDDGQLKELGISDQVWEYDDITRFETNPEEEQLEIADSLYSYGDEAITFSDEEQVEFSSITEDDTLSVVGIGKKILSVNITTGHGTLQLANTDLFEGSFIQLGSKIFALITKDMEMDLPEGTYQLTVANDGWGGTTEIEIVRGKTTNVDLDSIKGEGPKYGEVLFAIDVLDAVLYIDGQKVDYSEPIRLKYGKHSLSVVTEEYDTWERTLYVNSAEATVLITISDEESDSETTENSQTSEASEATESTESADSTQSTETESTDYGDLSEYLSDYLSTLSSLL